MTERDDTFAPDLGAFLAPIPGDDGPTGPSLRYDPVFNKIRFAREAEDSSLPRGDWTRPLKQSDWVAVERLCTEVLQTRSKDLQVAMWLCEAWLRLYGIAGLMGGIDLVMVLVRQFWEPLHPQIDDGDTDARVAPFHWANDTFPLILRLEVPLVHMPDHLPPIGTLDLWERTLTTANETSASRKRRDEEPEDGSKIAGRAEMMAFASGSALMTLANMHDDLHDVLVSWQLLSAVLDEKLERDAPGLGKVASTLEQLQRAVTGLLDGRDPRSRREEPDSHAVLNEPQPLHLDEVPMTATPVFPAAHPVASGPLGAISNRDDAYRLLEIAARYLEQNEPHSPTPYLVKRAVTWGRMSLADLMQEILREEGDLTRYFSLLGINHDRG